jgi:hypothetical protein
MRVNYSSDYSTIQTESDNNSALLLRHRHGTQKTDSWHIRERRTRRRRKAGVREARIREYGMSGSLLPRNQLCHFLVFDCLQLQRSAPSGRGIKSSMPGKARQSHQNQSSQLLALSPIPMRMTAQVQTRTVACICWYLQAVLAVAV